VEDESFRTQVRSDATTALRGYDLSDAEREAITSGDEAQLTELGVEATLSKVVRYGQRPKSGGTIARGNIHVH